MYFIIKFQNIFSDVFFKCNKYIIIKKNMTIWFNSIIKGKHFAQYQMSNYAIKFPLQCKTTQVPSKLNAPHSLKLHSTHQKTIRK